LVNEAALLAAREGEDAVHEKDFMDALEKIVLGPAPPIVLSQAERARVAYHEGGHAMLGLILPGADPVSRVTITPHGQALGVTYQRPEDDRHNYDEAYLRGRIIGAMGGRAAEDIVYGTRTTGAESDMQQATSIVRQMVTRWGMSDKLGPVAVAERTDGFLRLDPAQGGAGMVGPWRPYSDDTARLIDAEVRRMLDESYKRVGADASGGGRRTGDLVTARHRPLSGFIRVERAQQRQSACAPNIMPRSALRYHARF
jgi:cell division protease FtsH